MLNSDELDYKGLDCGVVDYGVVDCGGLDCGNCERVDRRWLVGRIKA